MKFKEVLCLNVCTFCDKEKEKNDLIEGMNGYLCKECLSIMKGIDNSKRLSDTNEKTNEGINKNIDIRDIKKEVDKVVFGQESAKKQLIIELYKHQENKNDTANNVFLVGDSGVGKTHLIRTLTRIMDVPYIEVDATTFTETGYKGDDITEILDRLILKEAGDTERVEKAVVFIDEIDKTTTTMNDSASSSKVQEALLKIIEGVEYNYNINMANGTMRGVINTKNIMFIVAGACVGLKEIRDERLNPNKSSIGFNSSQISEVNNEEYYIGDDLISFGFIPEFVGRYSLIVELEGLSREDIRSILLNSPDSILKENKELFKAKGVDLLIKDDYIEQLTDKIYGNPLGVRGISQFLTQNINELLYEALLSGTNTVTLTLDDKRYKEEVAVKSG